MGATNLPEVWCRIELAASLQPFLVHDAPQHRELVQEIEQVFNDLLQTLGIPGRPVVEVIPVEPDALYGGRFLRLIINDSPCAYPDELLQRVLAYIASTVLDPAATPKYIRTWMESTAEAETTQIRLLSLVCLEIIKLQPSVLLGEALVQAYAASLPVPSAITEPARLRAIFGEVVDFWISLADRQKVSDILACAHDDDTEVCEELIAALSADTIEIYAPRECQAQLSSDDSGVESEMVKSLRKDLFTEIGLWFPRFVILPNPDPNNRTFSFKINNVSICPYVGLSADECLVNDTVDRLKLMNYRGRPASNPATGLPGAVVDLSSQPELEAVGLTTWNPVGYLILVLASVLRRRATCLVHTRVVQDQLKLLGQQFPTLVDAVLERYSLTQIARVMRQLAADGLPLRTMMRVLERMLEYLLWPHDEPDLVAFARSGIARANGNKFARGTNTLVAYLLDSQIETALTHPLDEHMRAAIIQAVRNELRHLPPTAQKPVLLTNARARPILRAVLKCELPLVSVVAYDDFSPSLNIQPVARISIS